MIRPPSPCSRIRIAAARAHVNVPRRCVSHDEVEVLVGHLPQHLVAQHAGVGDHDVEAPERLDGASRRARRRSRVEPTGAGRGDAADRVRDLLGAVEVVDDDRRARRRERLRVRAAEPAPRAGDDRDLPVQPHA